MSQVTCGTILRRAREQKGYDLDSVARRLRIRPDVLRTIEHDDFANMPPRGYARNMVNAYSRLLGLNPTDVVNKFLDDAYAYDVKHLREQPSKRGNGGFEIGHEKRYSRADAKKDEAEANTLRGQGLRSSSSVGRVLYDDRTEYARRSYGANADDMDETDNWRSSSHGSRNRNRNSEGTSAGIGAAGPRNGNRRGVSRREERAGIGTVYAGSNEYSNGFLGGSDQRGRSNRSIYSANASSGLVGKLPIIIAAAVVLIIIIIVLSFIIGNRNSVQSNVADLPVTGISDTTTSEDEEVTPVVELAPTSVQVTYEVKNGQDAYLEIYVDDGEATAEMINGPATKTVEVTGKWTITTWAKDAITLTVDGEKVEMTSNEDYGGMYAYTVDFNAVLEAWNAEHPNSTKSSSATSSTSSSSSSSSLSSTGSSAGSNA